jgi:hypothetical protein
LEIKKARRQQAKLRMALIGPPGSGKTWTALEIASGIGGNILLVETEGDSSAMYADDFDFSRIALGDIKTDPYHPQNFVNAIKLGEENGFDIIIIDSLSHAWIGDGGALDLANRETIKSRSGNAFTAWRNVTPLHNKLVNSILQSKSHIIATMRSKEKRVIEQDEKGKTKIRTVGLEQQQRDGLNFEFAIVGDLDQDHNLIITKTRIKFLDQAVINRPSDELGKQLRNWLDQGDAPVAPTPEIKKTKAAPIARSEESSGPATTNVVALSDLYAKVSGYLVKIAYEESKDGIVELAMGMVRNRFDVEDPMTIPEDKFDELRTYLRGELIDTLRNEGLLGK